MEINPRCVFRELWIISLKYTWIGMGVVLGVEEAWETSGDLGPDV